MTETIIYNVIPKDDILADREYVQGLREEIEEKYVILKTIEITPALDEEGIKKFITGMEAHDHEERLKEVFEFAYGMPYEEKYREEAEKHLEELRKRVPNEFWRKTFENIGAKNDCM